MSQVTKSVIDEDEVLKELLERPVKIKIIWHILILTIIFHIEAIRGFYFVITGQVMWQTLVFAGILYIFSGFGVVAGVHRLWSHRSYKVNFPLRFILVIFNSIAYQKSVIRWARDHRVHHKYCDTNADPHNVKRGFFYSHIGWLFCKKHPATIEAGKRIDVSDLTSDKLLWLQNKYFFYISPLLCFILPTLIPAYFWGEKLMNAWTVAACLRFILFLHATLSINSFAHMYGYKPYDESITPVQSLFVSVICLGDGWHNYHHVFPWDYKSDEFGSHNFNLSAMFIEFMSKLGWAYDLRTTPYSSIVARAKKTGDGEIAKNFLENLKRCGKLDLF
ncbi:hypothetical protein PVAND_016901 [Polypedilum vanderplanki]|uniref:Fatty acid desaturase domain-containing protein n=1 Tax=Polypedilum vanderplanki TaxID=319348 RepID=A0A9J6BHR7_POLVA|nr:hypothetical protein PVAND_016901 [Polypedilum vanderplanki]